MIRFKIFFATICFLISNLAISQTNLLINGDFETGDKTPWTNGKNFSVHEAEQNTGTYAGEISGDSYTNQPATVTEGKTYRVSFFGKAAIALQDAYLSAQYQKGTVWTYINYVNIQATNWQEYSFVVNIASGQSNKFRIALRQFSGGKHYFDDVELTEITDPSSLSAGNDILTTSIGKLNNAENKIDDIPLESITAADLIAALTLSPDATVVLIGSDSTVVNPDTIIDGTETIKVFAENGVAQSYTMRSVSDSVIKSIDSDEAEIDNISFNISKITPLLTVSELVSGITLFSGGSLEVLDNTTKNVIPNQNTTTISESMIVKVTGSTSFTEYTLQLRAIETDNKIASIALGNINETTPAVENIPKEITASQLTDLIKIAKYASFKLTNNSGTELGLNDTVVASNEIRVTAEDGNVRIYQIIFGSNSIANVTYTDQKVTETQLSFTNIILNGNSELKITNTTNIFDIAIVNINSEDSWILFENILPSIVRDTYLKNIKAYGQPAVLNQNVRIVQYVNGAVVIPHAPNYGAVTIYDGANLTGNSMTLTPYTYNKIAQLGALNDAVASFKVKRGYYVTMAQNENGSGFSKVFLAHDADLTVNTMPEGLEGKVSFARVIPWRWPNKKGHPNNDSPKFNGGWKYNWNANQVSSLDVEYVPIKHKLNWPNLSIFKNIKGSPNMLAHNEPNAKEQANATIDQVLAQWPKLMESGLRLGSPAPTDGGLSSWLYPFIDKCDELNYRVDFVAIHYYRGCNTTNGQGIYNFAKQVHERTGRPIWITEFSNGAPWSSCTPDTESEHAEGLKEMIKRLEEAPFVERYCIFPYFWPFNKTLSNGALTENGIVYRDQVSTMAYNPAEAYDTTFETLTPPDNLTATFDADAEEVDLAWTITSDVEKGFKVYRSIDGGSYVEIARVEESGITTYTDTDILLSGEYSYRVKSFIPTVKNSGFSNIASTNVTLAALVNIAKNKAVTIYSNATGGYDYHSTYVPAGATDEDYTTNGRWLFKFDTNGGLPVTLEIDLVENYKLNAYKLAEDNKATKSYKIQYQDLKTLNWIEIANVTDNNNLVTSGNFADKPTTNKVRIVFNSSQDTKYIRLVEIEIYGENESLSTNFNAIERVALYPNPTKDNFIYVKGIDEITSVKVYNILGVKQKSNFTNNKIQVQNLASGLYMVVINNKRIGKFIKK